MHAGVAISPYGALPEAPRLASASPLPEHRVGIAARPMSGLGPPAAHRAGRASLAHAPRRRAAAPQRARSHRRRRLPVRCAAPVARPAAASDFLKADLVLDVQMLPNGLGPVQQPEPLPSPNVSICRAEERLRVKVQMTRAQGNSAGCLPR